MDEIPEDDMPVASAGEIHKDAKCFFFLFPRSPRAKDRASKSGIYGVSSQREGFLRCECHGVGLTLGL